MMIDWDLYAMICAVLAVVMRLCDRAQIAGILSSAALLFATLGQRAAHRRNRAALPRSASRR